MYLLNLPTLCVCSTQHNFVVPVQTELNPSCSQKNWGPILQLVTEGSPAQSSVPDFTPQQPNPMKSKWLYKCGTVLCSTELIPWMTNMCMHMRSIYIKTIFKFSQDNSGVYFSENIFQMSLQEKWKLLLQLALKQFGHQERSCSWLNLSWSNHWDQLINITLSLLRKFKSWRHFQGT